MITGAAAGPERDEHRYCNAPRYLLRKYCVLKMVKPLPRGKALDIGCGAGDMCLTLHRLGFQVSGIDYSEEAVALCRRRLEREVGPGKIPVELMPLEDVEGTYTLVTMLEVLEHIEDDEAALAKVASLLAPGGHLVLSVPAHRDWLGPHDRRAGHFRRYERDELRAKLEAAGLEVSVLWSYGFPLANLTKVVGDIAYARKIGTREEGTKRSGIERGIEWRFRMFSNSFFLWPFYLIQMLFKNTDWAPGYIVKARKK